MFIHIVNVKVDLLILLCCIVTDFKVYLLMFTHIVNDVTVDLGQKKENCYIGVTG